MCTLSIKASVLLAKMDSSTMLMSGVQNCGRVLKDDPVWFFVLIFFFQSGRPDIIHVINKTRPSSFLVVLRF